MGIFSCKASWKYSSQGTAIFLAIAPGFLSTSLESCTSSGGPGGFRWRAAGGELCALRSQPPSRLWLPGQPTTQHSVACLRPGASILGGRGREQALPLPEAALTPSLNWGAARRRWVPQPKIYLLGAPCLVKPLSGWVGWNASIMAACSVVPFKRILIGRPLFARSWAGSFTPWQDAEGLLCCSSLKVNSLCWGWGYPGQVSWSPQPGEGD